MAQINLLKQTNTTHNYGNATAKILVRVLLVVLVGLLAYYAWLFIDLKKTNADIAAMEEKVIGEKQAVLDIKNRNQLYTRQMQVQNLEKLVGAHTYWSGFFPEIARVTLKTAGYKNLTVRSDGTLVLGAVVPTLADLAKYMQVFDHPDFNKNFSNVKIGSFSQVQNDEATTIEFQVNMDFDPAIIQYQQPKQ
jgi:hypothetical protein